LIAGRLLDEREMNDDTLQRVVVNAALVARDFKDRDPIGQRFYFGELPIEIVGVVSDIRNFGPLTEPRPEAYWTFSQRFPAAVGFSLVIRTDRSDPLSVAGDVERALRGVYPGAAVSRVLPMQQVMADSIGWPRFIFALFATLASVALVLALAGLFGILSYAVEQQRREFAIRTALGASPARIRRQILGRAGGIVGLSLVAGLFIAWGVTRLMAALLFGVEPRDPVVWAAAALAMVAAGCAAAAAPAWRASRVEPMSAMRAEA
jgi:ABC-type antimicrobial peptide transport system permease subunit